MVAINQGGPTDLLQARVGALATPGDPVDFADKLARVLLDKSLAEQCRTYVAEHFVGQNIYETAYRLRTICSRVDQSPYTVILSAAWQGPDYCAVIARRKPCVP